MLTNAVHELKTTIMNMCQQPHKPCSLSLGDDQNTTPQYILSTGTPTSTTNPSSLPIPLRRAQTLAQRGLSTQSRHKSSSSQIPKPELVIPDVPALCPDGTRRPRKDSWRDIIKHWTDGDPNLGLHTPLRDWPPEWIRGNNRMFAMKHFERSVIALEFINTYHSDEASFLAAYPQAERGHTALLHAINAARRERGERETRPPRRNRRRFDWPASGSASVTATTVLP